MLEKTSISTVETLETVAADTDVNMRSKSFGVNEVFLVFEILKAKKPTKETMIK